METENNNQSGAKKGGVKVVIAISVVVILALVGVILWLVFSKNEEQDDKRNVVVTEDNVDQVIEDLENTGTVEPGYYTVTMNNEWHFKTGDSFSDDAYVANDRENNNDVYFDLFLESDETNAIYKSPVIPRGGKLEDIKLDTPLEDGTYKCVLIYHLVDENQNSLSTVRVAVTLYIGKE
jgi:cell division protein YceG involved in septum cleavage